MALDAGSGLSARASSEGNQQMKLTPKIASVAAAVVALGGAGLGTAVASSASTSTPVAAHSEPASPDNDAVQQGSQTGPDTVATTAAESATAENPGEAASSEAAPSDGPGGNADAAGNVQHEFNGTE